MKLGRLPIQERLLLYDRASIQPSAQDSTYGMLIQLCYRHIFLTPLLLFKALYGPAPAYLSDIISFKGDSNYNLRSNFSNLLAHPAIRSAKTTGDRAFSVAAPFLWNSLPESLRAVSSVNIFKKQLKTYLFKQAYC